MAQVLAPGVCQLKVSGTVAGNPWNCMLHYFTSSGTGNWSNAQLTAMGNAIMAGFQTTFQTVWGTNVIASSVVGVDLGIATPQEGVSNHAAVTGTGTTLTGAASCIMFNYLTNQRYRGGHGRTYLPGGAAGLSTDGDHWPATQFSTWVTGWATALQNAAQAAVTNGQSNATLCIPLYNYTVTDDPVRKKYIRNKVSFKTAALVQSVVGTNDIRSQRRRLGNR